MPSAIARLLASSRPNGAVVPPLPCRQMYATFSTRCVLGTSDSGTLTTSCALIVAAQNAT